MFWPLKFIDRWLNSVTMYRLVVYYLLVLFLIALFFSFFGILPFEPFALAFSAVIILAVSWLANSFSAHYFKVPASTESVYITTLILVLIITPPSLSKIVSYLPFLIGAAALAQISKYAINIKNKHIFNPAALAVALTPLALGLGASWWVGNSAMFWPVLIGGLLVIRKVRRFTLALVFVAAAVIATLVLAGGGLGVLQRIFFSSPLIFFAAIMLTEPLTLPPTLDKQIAYGILVGWLFAPATHFGNFYFSPETALLAGNVFSYIVSPKERLVLPLVFKRFVSAGIGEFAFASPQFNFSAGQYMEWTLGHNNADARGNRRYLTIASSPTEKQLLLGVKFYDQGSSYKRRMLEIQEGETIVAGQLAGDFVLPENQNEKLAFIAGGVGITPFRSMTKFITDTGQSRDVVLLYANRSAEEIAYKNIFDEAAGWGMKTFYVLSRPPQGWQQLAGRIDENIIIKTLPDYKQRTFYISGSQVLVEGVKKSLKNLGVPGRKIVTDFFPGLT